MMVVTVMMFDLAITALLAGDLLRDNLLRIGGELRIVRLRSSKVSGAQGLAQSLEIAFDRAERASRRRRRLADCAVALQQLLQVPVGLLGSLEIARFQGVAQLLHILPDLRAEASRMAGTAYWRSRRLGRLD